MRPLVLTDLDDTLFQTMPKCPPGKDGLLQMSSLLDGSPSGFATPMQQHFLRWLQDGTVVPVTARGTRQMVTTQTLGLPMRLATSSSILLCPGFPPSPLLRPFASRVLPYIHDDFLLTRRADLNTRARLYMAAPFKLALRHYPRFLANSNDTWDVDAAISHQAMSSVPK